MRSLVLIALSILLISSSSVADSQPATARATVNRISCRSTLDAARLNNVLYKNENIHGGRGRTFLDQGHRFGGTRTLKVAGTNGVVFSCFGLFRCDMPYGCRYYQAMCHDGLSNTAFINAARKNGKSTMVLVSNGGGLCIKINGAAIRYGNVHS